MNGPSRIAVGSGPSGRALDFPEGCRQSTAGFSLIEVVAAVGVFAIGMVAVLALFTPVAKSIGGVAEADASARLADLLHTRLQTIGIVAVAPLLKNATATGHQLTDTDAKTDYDITKDKQLIFANRDGTKLGIYTDTIWNDPATRQPSDLEKYFEIALIRNETLAPNDATADANAVVIAYTARVRWPAFIPDATPGNTRRALPTGQNPTGAVRFDHSQKQVFFFAGTVNRR